MDEKTFNERKAEALSNLPEEFHSAVSKLAWDLGHSSGYEEVLLYTDEMVYELRPAIKAYAKALKENN